MQTPRGWLWAVLVTACSFHSTLNMGEAQTFVTSALEKATGQKPVTTCPESVKLEQGGTFECTAKFGAVAARVVIVQDDDRGHVTIKSITGILVAAELEKQIADGIAKQRNVRPEVSCGDRIRAAVAGATFQCDVRDGEHSAKVDVKVKNDAGDVSWEVVKA
jgi:hypothetical protein